MEIDLAFVKRPQFWATVATFVAVEVGLVANASWYGWHVLSVYGFLLMGYMPWASKPEDFFRGGISSESQDRASTTVLTFSAFISWIFAKSVYNASTLGGKYGISGGWSYAAWWTSFYSSAAVIYKIRSRDGHTSLPEFLNDKYGRGAVILYAGLVAYRLYQEVWSNSMVVADFFGSYDEDLTGEAFSNWVRVLSVRVLRVRALRGRRDVCVCGYRVLGITPHTARPFSVRAIPARLCFCVHCH